MQARTNHRFRSIPSTGTRLPALVSWLGKVAEIGMKGKSLREWLESIHTLPSLKRLLASLNVMDDELPMIKSVQ